MADEDGSESARESEEAVKVHLLHYKYDPAHLADVTDEMRRRGAPRIRATLHDGQWFAHEGCHRLRAALALGVAPVMIPTPWKKSRAALVRATLRRGALLFRTVEMSRDSGVDITEEFLP